jgi:hypothetical protein
MEILRTKGYRPQPATIRFKRKTLNGLEFGAVDDGSNAIRRLFWAPGTQATVFCVGSIPSDIVLEEVGPERSEWVECPDIQITDRQRAKLVSRWERFECDGSTASELE